MSAIDHYSDEILIQAELVSPNDSLGGQNPDVLVNEAVVFLGDDLAGPDGGERHRYRRSSSDRCTASRCHADLLVLIRDNQGAA